MSKETARFNRELPKRERFYVQCIGLAFGNFPKVARRNWLRGICENRETLREAILLDFLRNVAKEMASVERHLRRGRGRPSMIEDTFLTLADSEELGLPLKKTLMKTGTQNNETASKKAAAIRSRKSRAKNVTK
jgi:hypothetical protein